MTDLANANLSRRRRLAAGSHQRFASTCAEGVPGQALTGTELYYLQGQPGVEDEEARLKLAQQEARTRIRQFENQCRKKKTFDIPGPKKPSGTSDVDSAVFVVEAGKKDISQAEIIATIVSKWRARARWSKVLREVRSMSLSNSDASPSRRPSPGPQDLLHPVTPSRTRASSTSSVKITSPCNSDTSLLRHSSPVPRDLLSPLTPTRARAASTGSIRLVVDSQDC